MICTNSDRKARKASSGLGLGLWAAAALAGLTLPLALGWAGPPLTGEQSQKIEAAAEQAGASVDLSRATETFEDPSVLFIPAAEGAHRYVLYDTKTARSRATSTSPSKRRMGSESAIRIGSRERSPRTLDRAGSGWDGLLLLRVGQGLRLEQRRRSNCGFCSGK